MSRFNKIAIAFITGLILTPSLAYATSVNIVSVNVSAGVKGGFFSPDYSMDVDAIVINKGRSGEANIERHTNLWQKKLET